jgi:hypothetical protein
MKRKTADAARNAGTRNAAARNRRRTAAAIDRLHESGQSMLPVLDLASRRRPGAPSGGGIRRVNVDFPEWMVAELDREAEHLGVTRQSVIKVFIAEQLRSARTA